MSHKDQIIQETSPECVERIKRPELNELEDEKAYLEDLLSQGNEGDLGNKDLKERLDNVRVDSRRLYLHGVCKECG